MTVPLELAFLYALTFVSFCAAAYQHGKLRGQSEVAARLLAEWEASNDRLFDAWRESLSRTAPPSDVNNPKGTT